MLGKRADFTFQRIDFVDDSIHLPVPDAAFECGRQPDRRRRSEKIARAAARHMH